MQTRRTPFLSTLTARLFLTLSIFHIGGEAGALSCWDLEHKFFVSCDAAACRGEFQVVDVGSFGPCGRRPLVQAIPAEVENRISAIVARAREVDSEPALYRVTIPLRIGHRSTEDDPKLIIDSLTFHSKIRVEDLIAQSPEEIRNFFELHAGRDWLVPEAGNLTKKSVDHTRAEWIGQERWEFALDIFWNVVFWGSFLIGFFASHSFLCGIFFAPVPIDNATNEDAIDPGRGADCYRNHRNLWRGLLAMAWLAGNPVRAGSRICADRRSVGLCLVQASGKGNLNDEK